MVSWYDCSLSKTLVGSCIASFGLNCCLAGRSVACKAADISTSLINTYWFPGALPLLPNVKDATLCNGPCMVSMQVVLLEDPGVLLLKCLVSSSEMVSLKKSRRAAFEMFGLFQRTFSTLFDVFLLVHGIKLDDNHNLTTPTQHVMVGITRSKVIFMKSSRNPLFLQCFSAGLSAYFL